MLHPTIKQKIESAIDKLQAEGKWFTPEKLASFYENFRAKFGPEVLGGLEGTALLYTLHGSKSSREFKKDSLAYWLEWKDDDEFPGHFGSIGGGSAYKFGLYINASEQWVTGTPQKPRIVSLQEAIRIAQEQRDQFLRGCKLLDELPSNGTDEDYRKLQKNLKDVAPDVYETAWGHKYFSLLYPDKLEDFQVEHFQRFNLTKLLQVPPEGQGRYLSGGRYVAIAKELGLEITRLTTALCEIGCVPYRYWRVGTTDGETGKSYWELMREGNYVSIGWPDLGDLSIYVRELETKDLEEGRELEGGRELKERIKKTLIDTYYQDKPRVATTKSTEIFQFLNTIAKGDLVIASDGARVRGVGRITGPYEYKKELHFPYCRPVEWLSLEEWEIPAPKSLLLSTVREVKEAHNLVEIEKRSELPYVKRYWVEMTHVKGHPDREVGEYKCGTALWCPQLTTQGQTYYAYENVKHVRPGDIILHLPDTEGFSGVSIAATEPDSDFICPGGTEWAGQPGYLVFLKDYKPLKGRFSRDKFLEGPVYEQLGAAFDKYKGLFYHKTDHKLTQGAYLTLAPVEIVQILNDAYKQKTTYNLPHFEDTDENGQIISIGPRNVIFYGPPGTGKTFKAINRALEIIHCDDTYCSQVKDRPQLVAEFKELQKEGRIEFVTFHQAYSYEEFVEGIRPKLDQGNIEYELHEGVFKRIARIARESSNSDNYVLIIDEINRGNISKIFGELITLIEEDKREGAESEIRTTLPYSKKPFCVPANLYIIGTMNTADRSIALMDIALRRRFTFEEFMPQYAETGLDASDVDGLNLGALLRALNERITILLDRDHQIGHSFFMKIKDVTDASDQKQVLYTLWYRELVPLFQEYFYNDYEKLKQLLGKYSNTEVERGFIEEKRRKEIENLIGADEGIFSDGYVRSIHTYEDADSLISALKQYALQTAAAL